MSESEKEFLLNNLNKLIPKHLFKEFLLTLTELEVMPVNFKSQSMFKELPTFNPKIKLADTLHYIAFDLATKHIMILPFSFIGEKFPENRINALFPDGCQYFKFSSNAHSYCYLCSAIADNKQNSDKAFLGHEKKWIYGNVVIGSYPVIPDGNLYGLTFDKVLEILSTLELSNNYEYFVFYPPC